MFTSFIANNEVINKISLLAMRVREKFDDDVRKISDLGPIPYSKFTPDPTTTTRKERKRSQWTHFYLLQLQRNLYFKEKKVLVCCVVMVLTLVCCQLQNTQERIAKWLDSLGSRVGNSLPKLSTVRTNGSPSPMCPCFTLWSHTHCMRSQDLNARVSKQFAPQAILQSWGKKRKKRYIYIFWQGNKY